LLFGDFKGVAARRHFAYVFKLVRFAFAANRWLYASVAVSLVSVVIELLAMSSLMPLFEMISVGRPSSTGLLARGLMALGVTVTARALLWTFIALFAMRVVTQLLGQSLSMFLGRRVLAQLSSKAFEQIVHRLSIREINEKSIGFYIGLAGDEAFRASTLVVSITQFVSTAALCALYFSAIALHSRAAAGIVIVFMSTSLIAMFWILKASHRLGARQTVESRRSHSIFLDSLNNLKTVRAYSAEKYVAGIHRTIIFGYTEILFWIDEIALLATLIPVLLLIAIFGVWLSWGAQPVEQVGLAFIVTMIVYLMRFLPTLGQGAHLLFKVASDARSGKDVTAMLNGPAAAPAASSVSHGPITTVRFQDVHFSYTGTPTGRVLEGINVDFACGKSYALVGRSGAGKSTLVDILLRFYLPTAGRVYFNEVSTTDITDAEIRKRIILVSQEGAIFDDTVANNVRLGQEASAAEVRAACEAACIHQFIDEMPEGYESRLQYQGKNLSGGQRQRIAIARGLLRNPDVLVLDESTSALDKATQKDVVENILREYATRIVIFVTHDPHIMKRVNVVLDFEVVNPAAAAAPNPIMS